MDVLPFFEHSHRSRVEKLAGMLDRLWAAGEGFALGFCGLEMVIGAVPGAFLGALEVSRDVVAAQGDRRRASADVEPSRCRLSAEPSGMLGLLIASSL